MTTACALPPQRPRVAPDDALKDLDCLGFARAFDPPERARWEAWIGRLRLADRLAETDPEALRMLRAFDYGDERPCAASAWSRYLDALAHYHRPGLIIRTLAEHDEMLLRLSGPLLQLAPGMPEELWEAAAHFGALDQFYNNLRDMQEDAARGLCWLPEEVLRWHRITREDVIAGRAPDMPEWRTMMMWWWDERRIWLFRRGTDLVGVKHAHPSIRAMVAWTLRRYERVMRVFRAVDYDYRRFPERYWAEVRRELGGLQGQGR